MDISFDQYINRDEDTESRIILDVRAPSEYAVGRIPGALSLPLFTDEERAEIGTTYKQVGPKEAVDRGLQIVGPKMFSLVERARELAPSGKVLVHCWRGGMRSGSMAWLLETAGFDVLRLTGGYKQFRAWAHEQIENPPPLINIGGFTGSGKTEILEVLKERGEPVLDLEGLARHRGSAFGHVGLGEQPSTEHFINTLGHELFRLKSRQSPVWVEDESRLIGMVVMPDSFFDTLRVAPLVVLQRSRKERADRLARVYGTASQEELLDSFHRIAKRLGGLTLKEAVEDVRLGRLSAAAEKALSYYDKAYAHGLDTREEGVIQTELDLTGKSDEEAAETLLKWKREWMSLKPTFD